MKYLFINTIDTLHGYLPIEGKSIEEFHEKINGIDYYYDNITDEVEYSYILKQLGEPILTNSNQHIIRLLYPCEELNSCQNYNLIKIKFIDNSAKLYFISASSKDFNGIQVIHSDSCILKKKDIKNTKEKLSKVIIDSSRVCRSPGNPWLLEYTDGRLYKRFLISPYCIRKDKKLKSIFRSDYFILVFQRKYFKKLCFKWN